MYHSKSSFTYLMCSLPPVPVRLNVRKALWPSRYFICADVCLIMQYIYYGTLQRRRERALLLRSARRRSGPRGSSEIEARCNARSCVYTTNDGLDTFYYQVALRCHRSSRQTLLWSQAGLPGTRILPIIHFKNAELYEVTLNPR